MAKREGRVVWVAVLTIAAALVIGAARASGGTGTSLHGVFAETGSTNARSVIFHEPGSGVRIVVGPPSAAIQPRPSGKSSKNDRGALVARPLDYPASVPR